MSSIPSSSPTRAPGSMTLAMQAIRPSQDLQRLLRVGVIHDAHVIEERVLRDHQTVTVGTHERNTFTLGADAALPSRLELFVRRREGYALRVSPGMTGRLLVGDQNGPLEAFRGTEGASGGFDIPLDDRSRGKVTVGATTFLFQFVAPPPVQARPQLPIAIRSRALSSMDWTYNAFVAGFLAITFGGVSYVEYLYDPEVEDAFELPAAVPSILSVLPPSSIESPPSAAGATDPTDTASTVPTPTPSRPSVAPHAPPAHAAPTHDASETAEAESRRAADAADRALERLAHFDPIVGIAPNAHTSAVDGLFNGHDMHDTQHDLAMLGGIDRGHETALGIDRRHLVASNGPASNSLERGHHIDLPVGPVSDGTTQNLVARAPQLHLAVEPPGEPTGPGDLPPEQVAAVVRRNLGALRWCYNEAIRQAPSLSGRLEVHFTIGESGRIIGAPHLVGFDEAPAMRACVATRFRGFAFPQPTGGAVEFMFPFSFSSGQ